MRRTLALAAVALGAAATFAPVTAASAAPDCNVFQNCVCTTANKVAKAVTGDGVFDCV